MGFSATADRMVWPPSLLRDWKWPRPPIRRKTTLWMRVTPVAYKLEQSVMGQKMCFSNIYVVFGVWTKILIISTIFRKKTRNSLFRNVKLQSAITPVLSSLWSVKWRQTDIKIFFFNYIQNLINKKHKIYQTTQRKQKNTYSIVSGQYRQSSSRRHVECDRGLQLLSFR